MKKAAVILKATVLALLMTGCATAVTSYNVTYGNEECPIKVKAETSVGVSVQINDNLNCEPDKEEK